MATAHESRNPPAAFPPQPQPPLEPGIKTLIASELRKQWPIAIPLVGMNMTWTGKIVLTTAFLSHLGELQLAGGALALMFANVTGFAVLTGLCTAMEPICGQAYGAGNFRLMHRTLLMTIVLLLFASVPISVVWLNVDRILEMFGQQPDIAAMAKSYLCWLLPQLVVTAFLGPMKAYLNSQGATVPILVSSVVAFALHVPINILLSRTLGVRGVAIGVWITDLNVAFMLVSYVLWRECRRRNSSSSSTTTTTTSSKGIIAAASHPEIEVCEDTSTSCSGWCVGPKLRDWSTLLRLSGPCCLTTCLEWWCYEINVLLTGRLRNAERAVSVLTIVLNLDYLVYAVMLSVATCASIRVSNELGAGNALAARRSARVSFLFSVIIGLVAGLSIIASRGVWGSLFSHNPAIVSRVKSLLPLLAVMEMANSSLLLCSGVARGTAKPQLGMYATLGGFYLIALPLGALLAFKVKMGVTGLLLGLLVGVITGLSVLLVLVGRIDWVFEARRAYKFATEGKVGDSVHEDESRGSTGNMI